MIGDRWGVTDAEAARRYPCDDIVQTPAFQAWRGVTARAPADSVWPWVAQIRETEPAMQSCGLCR